MAPTEASSEPLDSQLAALCELLLRGSLRDSPDQAANHAGSAGTLHT